jgi:radical SAM-linked protein
MAMNRASLEIFYTQGFNPLAKLEIVSPLSTGISARAEIAAVDLPTAINSEEFIKKINLALVEGIRVNDAQIFRIAAGQKKHSLSSLHWGFAYSAKDGGTDYIPAKEEKAYRTKCLAEGETVFSLHRTSVLAKNILDNDPGKPWASYFDAYRFLYPGE